MICQSQHGQNHPSALKSRSDTQFVLQHFNSVTVVLPVTVPSAVHYIPQWRLYRTHVKGKKWEGKQTQEWYSSYSKMLTQGLWHSRNTSQIPQVLAPDPMHYTVRSYECSWLGWSHLTRTCFVSQTAVATCPQKCSPSERLPGLPLATWYGRTQLRIPTTNLPRLNMWSKWWVTINALQGRFPNIQELNNGGIVPTYSWQSS